MEALRRDAVDEVIARLTLEERVGQLLMALPSRDAPPSRLADELHVGGVLLPNETTGTPQIVVRQIAAAQDRARAATGLSLFIAADQEGGDMSFLRDLVTEVPSNMAIGATGDPTMARDAAAIIAADLVALGVNWDFAPVLDVNTDAANPVIGVRAYGDDPAAVAAFGAEAIAGLQAHGLLACAKHFPGHGATSVDSHVAMPVVAHGRERLEGVELVPFRAGVAAGVASVMTGHLLVPALDEERPSTLSQPTLTGLLRGELAYDGLVVTDAMPMGAISGAHDEGDAAVAAIQAGADVVLGGTGLARHRRVHRTVLSAVRSGVIAERRFASALERVVRAKLALPSPAPHGRVREHASVDRAVAIARRGITVIRDEARLLPLPRDLGERLVVLSPAGSRATKMEQWHSRPTALGALVAEHAPGAVDIPVSYPPTRAQRAEVARTVRTATVVVAGTLNASLDPTQIDFLAWLAEVTTARIVVVALRGPYDATHLPWIGTVVCAYSSAAPSLVACAEVLTGARPALGRLPVSLGVPRPKTRRTSA